MSADRRREERVEAAGAVSMETTPPLRRVIQGSLMDVSSHGFRAAHTDRDLAPGDKVRFSHSLASGEAVVVWTRIVEGQRASGFLILDLAGQQAVQ